MGVRTALRRIALEVGLVDRPRERVALRHIRGEGIEVGALHQPLRVAEDVTVRYVDNTSREESLAKFPEIDPALVVTPHYIEDGFRLAGMASETQDFVIANHVLEHAPNPIGVLQSWGRVLRRGGHIFFSVPVVTECFDRGRRVTSVEHMMEDFRASRDADATALSERNREHYVEWLTVSEPNIYRDRGETPPDLSGDKLAARVDELVAGAVEIHFHTFSLGSVGKLLDRFVTDVAPEFAIAALAQGKEEVIAVLRKSSNRAPA